LLHIKQWWEFYNKEYAPASERATDTPEQADVSRQATQQTNNGQKLCNGTVPRSVSNNGTAHAAEVHSNQNGVSANAQATAETADSKANAENGNGFTNWLAEQIGASKRTARRLTQIVKKFTEEELEKLYSVGLTEQQVEAIAKEKNEAKRKDVTARAISTIVVVVMPPGFPPIARRSSAFEAKKASCVGVGSNIRRASCLRE
jgi:hypothetical protein